MASAAAVARLPSRGPERGRYIRKASSAATLAHAADDDGPRLASEGCGPGGKGEEEEGDWPKLLSSGIEVMMGLASVLRLRLVLPNNGRARTAPCASSPGTISEVVGSIASRSGGRRHCEA